MCKLLLPNTRPNLILIVSTDACFDVNGITTHSFVNCVTGHYPEVVIKRSFLKALLKKIYHVGLKRRRENILQEHQVLNMTCHSRPGGHGGMCTGCGFFRVHGFSLWLLPWLLSQPASHIAVPILTSGYCYSLASRPTAVWHADPVTLTRSPGQRLPDISMALLAHT